MNTVNMRHGRKNGGPGCRRYHHGDLRETLISAGMEALGEETPAELSLRHLARRAGVTPPAAYRHFRSKDDLLDAIAEEGFRDLNTRFEEAISGADEPSGQLTEVGVAYVRFAKEKPGLFRLMFGAMGPSVQPGEEARRAFGTLRELGARMQGGAGAEAVRADTIGRWSMVHGFAMLLIDGRLDEADDFEPLLREVLAR